MDGNKAIFLDRDGTINKDKNYLHRISEFEYIEGAIDGLKKLSNMGYLLVIITNQSGIARGFYSEQDYLTLDMWMRNDLSNKGIIISNSYYCPHLPNGVVPQYTKECDCRKPKTGLFWKARNDLNIDMCRSYAIGDKYRDLSICEESDVKGILFSKEKKESSKYTVCASWIEIIDYIKRESCNIENEN